MKTQSVTQRPIRWPLKVAFCLLCVLMVSGCQESEQPNVSASQPPATISPSPLEQGRKLLFSAPNRYAYPEAITMLEKALTAEPDNPKVHVALAFAYAKRSNYARIIEHVDEANKHQGALSAHEKLWLAALGARARDESGSEAALWQAVVDEFPNDRWAWYELASAHASVQNYSAAAQAAEQALKVESDPTRWEASWIYYLHSKALFRSGDYEAAVVAGAAGQGLQSTWRSTYYRMAMAQIAAGDDEVAASFVNSYRDISNAEGRNNESYTEANIALFYYELGDFKKALSHAQRSFELEPKAYQAWTLSFSQTENRQAEAALRTAENALSEFPNDAMSMAAKSWALFRLDRLAEAEEAIRAAQAGVERSNRFFDETLAIIVQAQSQPGRVSDVKAPWLG